MSRYGYKEKALQAAKAERQNFSYFWICIIVFGLFSMLLPIYERIAPLYASMYQFKMDYIGLTSMYIVVPYLILITLFLYRQQKRASLSDYFIIFLTLFYFLPGNVLYTYGNWNFSYQTFHLLSYLSLSTANELIPNIHFSQSVSQHQHKEILPLVSYFISLTVILLTIYYNGLQLNLNLDDVYDLRQDWKNSGMPNIFNYYIPFAARITPILLIITLKQRKILLSSLLIFSQLVSFSFGGMKYTLFALLLGILFHFFGQKLSTRKIFIYFSVFIGICLIECLLMKDQLPLLTVYTLRRTSFIPNQIGSFFFSFAQSHDYLYYSESFLRGFLYYPYSDPFPHVIAEYAFNLPEVGANTGLFAEGFSQIGWLSLPVYAILYIITFRLYTMCCSHFLDTRLSHIPLLGIVLYTTSFIDGAFFSIILTQGGFLTGLSLYILSRKTNLL